MRRQARPHSGHHAASWRSDHVMNADDPADKRSESKSASYQKFLHQEGANWEKSLQSQAAAQDEHLQ